MKMGRIFYIFNNAMSTSPKKVSVNVNKYFALFIWANFQLSLNI